MTVRDSKDIETRDREEQAVDANAAERQVERRPVLRQELRASFERVFAKSERGLRYLAGR